MNHASLCTGIGGFDLAAEWMNWNNVFQCEINEFCQTHLKYHWPKVKRYGNIKQTNFIIHKGTIDILTAGFPCQPYSLAGKREGKADERHLWPEVFRAIREVQPTYFVGENVRGLVNWNGGLVLQEITDDLEAAGYEVIPVVLSSASIGADNLRERIWICAYNDSFRRSDVQNKSGVCKEKIQNPKWSREEIKQRKQKAASMDSSRNSFEEFEKSYGKSAILGMGDELPYKLDSITTHKYITESLTALGNAINPEVAFQIFKTIELSKK